MEKSVVLAVGRVENLDCLALELGCNVASLPTTYLGLPLGAKHYSVTVWDGVEERFRKRLSIWKRQYISKGGILTLIRNTISNMPIYLMSLFRMPRKLKSKIEKIQRDFLWGGGNLERKIHMVKWKTVYLSQKNGGLGIRNLSTLIGPSLVNGHGDLLLKKMLHGVSSSA